LGTRVKLRAATDGQFRPFVIASVACIDHRPRECPDFRKWYADAMKFEPKKSDVHLAGLQAELEEIEKKVIRSSAKKRKPFESS